MIDSIIYWDDEGKTIPVTITKDNFFQLKFFFEKELLRTRNRLVRFKDRGVITNISKHPKIINKKYTVRINNLLKSRKSIKKILSILPKIRAKLY